MPLTVGEPAPWFRAPTPANPSFVFSSVGGRWTLMAFLPPDPAARERVLARVRADRARFNDHHFTFFAVTPDPDLRGKVQNELPGIRWFFDPGREVATLYGAHADGVDEPHWVLIDPMLRVMATAPIDEPEPIFALMAALPGPDDHAGVPMHAPVLIVPRVIEPDICRRLIDLYEATGGQASGVMREIDGKTVGVLDDYKSRRDVTVDDEAFRLELRSRMSRRLAPEIQKAFRWQATRMERYIVARYAAEEGGYFRPHRDNTTKGTAHRAFAVSINLNAEEFEGGDLRFPEFGTRTYRPPTGGAVVFSCSLLHEATPVTRGHRYAFLPFLYDEAGAAIREANLQFLATAAEPPTPQEDAEPAAVAGAA